jgi:glycosyltransferase involved in cell wall biosynthesis
VYEALESVRRETYPDVEVIVVDDGGGFVAPADSAGAKLRVVRGGGLGVGPARNLGLDAARGEFVIFLDDDDVALPNRIARLVTTAKEVHSDLCFGMTRRTAAGAALPLPDVPTQLLSPGAVGFGDILACAPHVNSVLVRTETLRAAGGFDVGAAHFDDWSAWLRIADQGNKMWHIGDVVAEWRIHEQGLSAKVLNILAMKARLIALFERLTAHLSNENVRAVAMARRLVVSGEIVTYDDYVAVMTRAREAMPKPLRGAARSSRFR